MTQSPHLSLASSLIPHSGTVPVGCSYHLIRNNCCHFENVRASIPSLRMRHAVERKDPFKIEHFKLMLLLFDVYGAIFMITTFIK